MAATKMRRLAARFNAVSLDASLYARPGPGDGSSWSESLPGRRRKIFHRSVSPRHRESWRGCSLSLI